MRERLLGIVAIAALLWTAYHASARTTAGWAASAAEKPAQLSTRAPHPGKPIPDADVIVGRPHDGIVALPSPHRLP
jgi:hypothetical protein